MLCSSAAWTILPIACLDGMDCYQFLEGVMGGVGGGEQATLQIRTDLRVRPSPEVCKVLCLEHSPCSMHHANHMHLDLLQTFKTAMWLPGEFSTSTLSIPPPPPRKAGVRLDSPFYAKVWLQRRCTSELPVGYWQPRS